VAYKIAKIGKRLGRTPFVVDERTEWPKVPINSRSRFNLLQSSLERLGSALSAAAMQKRAMKVDVCRRDMDALAALTQISAGRYSHRYVSRAALSAP
jgi:hypothetical protein